MLDKALALAEEAAQQEQEKVAALDMENTRPEIDDWNRLSEMEKDDIRNDINTIDDYSFSR